MLKYLRIAATVVCLTAGVLLIALWARSYVKRDTLLAPIPGPNGGVEAISGRGRLTVLWRFRDNRAWPLRLHSVDARWVDLGCTNRYEFAADLPHWNLAVAALAIAAAPWLRWRYSLRTLLVAMAVASLALGMIAVSNQSGDQSSTEPHNYPRIQWGKIWR